jgi:cytidylate kinase
MIEPIDRELREYLDSILDGDFRGVDKRIRRRCWNRRHRSRAPKEKIEELKRQIHEKDYLDGAIEQMALYLARGICKGK